MREPKIGEKIFVKTIPQYTKADNHKPCKVTRYALGYVWYKPNRWRGEDLECPLEDIEFAEPEKLELAEKKEIINRLVLKEFLPDYKAMIRELGVLSQLTDRYRNLDFWRNLEWEVQLKTLAFFIGAGEKELRIAYNKYVFSLDENTTKQENIEIGTEKIGIDLEIVKKPKNLLDLL